MVAFGWKPDTPDRRDFRWAAPGPLTRALPQQFNIGQRWLPPVWDQGNVGSCTAFAALAGMEVARRKAKQGAINASKLFTYWSTRELENGRGGGLIDSGASIRATIQAVARHGAATEKVWPYQDGRNWNVEPPPRVWAQAQDRQVIGYHRVQQDAVQLAAAIYSGLPVVFGSMLYESLWQADGTGDLPMPELYEQPLGGHAMLLVGYDFATRRFRLRNSWGKAWGDEGYGTIPMEYITDPELSADFWAVTSVES